MGTGRHWLFAVIFAAGCYAGRGDIDGGGADGGDGADDAGEGGDDASGGTPAELSCEEIGAQPLRRVSSDQYANIIAELLPPELAAEALATSIFPDTAVGDGFSTFAAANTVSSAESIQIEDNAEAISILFHDGRATYLPQLMPCVSASYMPSEIDGCIDEFVADFGARAFRRPLTEAETAIAKAIYEGIAAEEGPEAGVTSVLQYFLEAPALLYAVERGLEPVDGFAPLTSDELATRLALFLRDGAPDEELRAAVAEGRLVTREDVETQARRLLQGPGAVEVVGKFHREWLRSFELEDATREHEAFTADVQAAMVDEVDAFTQWFMSETDGSFATLMTTNEFPVDDRLAALYGVSGDGPVPNRHGVFTLASVMAAQSHESRTSLIERGSFVRTHLLCSPTPPLPGNVDADATLGGSADLPTARQRYQPLLEEPACAGCHVHINPFGFPLEVYDHAGVYRTTENGEPIDTSFDLMLGDLEGSFDGPGDLMATLADSEQAQACYATHAFRYALGRIESDEDECTLQEIADAFTASGGDVRELMVAIATSDAFMFRAVGGAQ